MQGMRCRFPWYTEALPPLLRFGEEEPEAGNGIRVSAEHSLSQASFLYPLILILLYLTALSLEIWSMVFLHAVPIWCTLHVSTSAVLDVFSLDVPLLASDLGSLYSKQESSSFRATQRRRHSPAGAAGGWCSTGMPARASRVRPPSRTKGEISAEDPVLLTRQVPGSVKKPEGICRRERVQPNLTNPSCADVLPRPSRTLMFYPKEQCAKGAGGCVPRCGTQRSQTTADEVSA